FHHDRHGSRSGNDFNWSPVAEAARHVLPYLASKRGILGRRALASIHAGRAFEGQTQANVTMLILNRRAFITAARVVQSFEPIAAYAENANPQAGASAIDKSVGTVDRHGWSPVISETGVPKIASRLASSARPRSE